MIRRTLLGSSVVSENKHVKKKRAKKAKSQYVGPVSTAQLLPRVRKLPTARGENPTPPEVTAALDGACDLGECGRRLQATFPDWDETRRLAALREYVLGLNTRWLASDQRKELRAVAARNSEGEEVGYLEEEAG